MNWHRAGRIVALALFMFFAPPAVAMTIQGDHTAANNALALPLCWCTMLWFLGVPTWGDDDG